MAKTNQCVAQSHSLKSYIFERKSEGGIEKMKKISIPTREVYLYRQDQIKKVYFNDLVNTDKDEKFFYCRFCEENFKGNGKFLWYHKEEIICYKCVDGRVVEQMTYGFYLRFAHDHIRPCVECQSKLHNLLFGNTSYTWNFNDSVKISLHMETWNISPTVSFSLGFLKENVLISVSFELCMKCSEKTFNMIQNASELTIGNKDYEPPVELWRRWEINDELTDNLIP